jgi:Nucleotidyl transferase AbiEii toxin, Type IV TA system
VDTSGGKLDALQKRVLDSLAAIRPPFILGGGGALAGVHLPHRQTRDLDSNILVDTPRAILTEKLCALLERSELRDLIDVEALVRSGESLSSAVANAPRRDTAFSPLTLAWVLRDWQVRKIALSAGLSDADAESLEHFRQSLVDYLISPEPIG